MEMRPTSPTDPTRLAGLFAAVVTPTDGDGRLDLQTFDRLVDLAVESGASGICIAGATGEYPHFEVEERKRVIRRAAARLPRDRALLVGIGAPALRHSIELGECAMDSGSRALLLPMPMFFRYEQADLEAFSAHVSGVLRAPCLLYNLPGFTNGLSVDTMLGLLRGEEFIVGVKDSSGEDANLRALAQPRGDLPWSLLVGDDHLLRDGLLAGWDGGISGVAGFCPELLVAVYRSFTDGRLDDAARLQNLLDELISQIAPFPTPWGIKIGLAARGIETGPMPLPVTTARRQQIAAFAEWFPAWSTRTGIL
jgi:4-hydroxy-tetrahydrodipicolinate synthase